MADEADLANDYLEAELERLLKSHKKVSLESLQACESCGDDIPRARQLAAKGCSLCIDCQTHSEVKKWPML